MTVLKIAFLLICTCASCPAQADFRFYVFDDTKNGSLDYTFVQDITVYDWGSEDPHLMFDTEYRISGINQKAFSFTTERYEASIPRKEYKAFIKRGKKLPTAELKESGKSGASGWIKIDGKEYNVSASPDTKIRIQWQAFLDEFLAKYAPVGKREKSARTIQGDLVEAVPVKFAELLENPKKFDGKRIRITGFYHGEFEGSSFASSAKDISIYDRALWLAEDSSFADPKKIPRPNDSTLTVDGTFELGPGGHMGLWMGELVRVTAISKTEGGAEQPAMRPQSKPEGGDKPQPE